MDMQAQDIVMQIQVGSGDPSTRSNSMDLAIRYPYSTSLALRSHKTQFVCHNFTFMDSIKYRVIKSW